MPNLTQIRQVVSTAKYACCRTDRQTRPPYCAFIFRTSY